MNQFNLYLLILFYVSYMLIENNIPMLNVFGLSIKAKENRFFKNNSNQTSSSFPYRLLLRENIKYLISEAFNKSIANKIYFDVNSIEDIEEGKTIENYSEFESAQEILNDKNGQLNKLPNEELFENSTRKSQLNSGENYNGKELFQIIEKIKPIFEEESLLQEFQSYFLMQIRDFQDQSKNTILDKNYMHNHYKIKRCNVNNCPSKVGYCDQNEEKICYCNTNNVNFIDDDLENEKIHTIFRSDLCGYQLLSQKLAMGLELFLPIGIGHLYAKRYLFGIIKFISFFIIPIFIFILFDFKLKNFITKNPSDNQLNQERNINKKNQSGFKSQIFEGLKIGIFTVKIVSFFSWYVIDAVSFGLGYYKDGYGFNLI